MTGNSDPYLYPRTQTLKNRRGLRDAAQLQTFETSAVARRMYELRQTDALTGLNLAHFKAIHGYLFQDVYEWAGQLRTTALGKQEFAAGGGVHWFTAPEQMEAKLTSLFANLKNANLLRDLPSGTFSQNAARLLGELNEVHAFREGNGRTQRFFLETIANQAGHPLSFDVVTRERMIQASIAYSRGNASLFERMFEEIADPARVEPLRQAIDFLAQQQFGWNEAYLATTVPGQHYSGTLAGRNAGSFLMLTTDRQQILIGATNDIPNAKKTGDYIAFFASGRSIGKGRER